MGGKNVSVKMLWVLIGLLCLLLGALGKRGSGRAPRISADPFEAVEGLGDEDEEVDLDSLETKDTDEKVLKKEAVDKWFGKGHHEEGQKIGRGSFRDMLIEYYAGTSREEALEALRKEELGVTGEEKHSLDQIGNKKLNRKQVADVYRWVTNYMRKKVNGLWLSYQEVIGRFVEDRGEKEEGVEHFQQAEGLDIYHKSKAYLKKHPGYSHDFVKTMVESLDYDL